MNVLLCTGVLIVSPCWNSRVIALQSNSCSTGIHPYCWVGPIPRSLLYHLLSRWWVLKRLCHKETWHCDRSDGVGKLLSPVDNCIYTCNDSSSKQDHSRTVVFALFQLLRLP